MVTNQCFENYWVYVIESCHWALGTAISIQSFHLSFWLQQTSVLRTTGHLIDSCHWARGAVLSIPLYQITFWLKETSVLRTTGHLIDSCHWAQGAVISIPLYQINFWLKETSVLRTTGHLIDSCHWAQGAAINIYNISSQCKWRVDLYREPVFWELLCLQAIAFAGHKVQQTTRTMFLY